MIISRTPFRLSFLGGGTDLPSFYQEEEGAVISTSIDKYMYITINNRFDHTFRLGYSRTEIQNRIEDIEHPILRQVLLPYKDLIADRNCGLEILSMADIPAGTGLGSSSSFTVGLIHALKAHLGIFQSAEQLASEACDVEINQLKEPIGKQDQYAAAYGGLQYIRFQPDGKVSVDPVICSTKTRHELESSVMMFYTGTTRSASKILAEQKTNTTNKMATLRGMRDLAFNFKCEIEKGASMQTLGEVLHAGWELKKTMASGISDGAIDDWYLRSQKAGAFGGKILGAGGGGFLMLLAPLEKQAAIEKELKELRRIPLSFESWGSKIIFVGER